MLEKKSLLIPMSKKEIAAAFGISYNYLWRKIKHLDIPPTKVLPDNILEICNCLQMDIDSILLYIEKYNFRK